MAGLAGTPPGRQRSAIDDASVITAAAYAAQVLTFFAGLIQKGLLGPVGTGYWALMQSFWQISKVVSAGAFDGTGRQIPLYRGRRDYAGAAAVSDTGFSFSLVAMAVLGLVVTSFALAFGSDWAPEIRLGLVLLGVTGPLRWLGDAHEVLLHATRRFRPASVATVLQAVVALTAQTALVVAFGFYGMFAGVVLATLVSLAYYARIGVTSLRRPAFRFRVERSRLGELVAFGLPIMVFGQLWLLFMGIDVLIIAGFIDVESLGYYALAVSVTSYVMHLPRSVGQALFPRMAELFGATGDVSSLSRYVGEAQRLLAYMLVPVFVAGAYFAIPVLIRHALPEFEPAIDVVHIMVAGSFIMALCSLPIKAMLTAGRRRALIVLVALCLGVNASANYVAVAVLEKGIEGAAVATVASYLFAFLVTSGYGLTMMIGARRALAHIGELLLAFAYVCGALWAIETLVGDGAGPLVGDAATAAAKLALFLVALTPWLIVAQVQLGGLSRVAAALRSVLGALARRRGR
ncbi:MAG: oligosaccharide flippase family protein [Solirubrobacteraceae bacterium]|nr:oligosaccharide flippase family protein [Solirubrobacteraceae bacterium]